MRVDAFSVMIFRLSTTPGNDLVLEAGVEILGVLADDDQIDVGEACVHTGNVPHGPEVRVQIQRLPQADVDARESFRDRRRHRALERDLVAADRVEERAGQRLVVALERGDSRVVAFPLDVDAGRLEDADDGGGDFRPDAVAWNERDDVTHRIGALPGSTGFRRVLSSSAAVRFCTVRKFLQVHDVSRRARRAATASSSCRSASPNAAGRSLSMSISPSTRSPSMIGTTISDFVSTLHAR